LQETLCLSAQERLIILIEYQGQNLSNRIGGKEGKETAELVIASENVATPAEKEITCSMMGAIALVYSRARFVHCTRDVVVLNEGMGWVK